MGRRRTRPDTPAVERHRAACKVLNAQPHRKATLRAAWLKNKYGITPEEYSDLLTQQRGRCAICGFEPEISGRRLAVDHCHRTGKVRGLLCFKCNTAIGKFNDDIGVLASAIKYLVRAAGWRVRLRLVLQAAVLDA